MGNGTHGAITYRSMGYRGHMGNGAQGVMITGGMGHMDNGTHWLWGTGVWVTWTIGYMAMGYRGNGVQG